MHGGPPIEWSRIRCTRAPLLNGTGYGARGPLLNGTGAVYESPFWAFGMSFLKTAVASRPTELTQRMVQGGWGPARSVEPNTKKVVSKRVGAFILKEPEH